MLATKKDIQALAGSVQDVLGDMDMCLYDVNNGTPTRYLSACLCKACALCIYIHMMWSGYRLTIGLNNPWNNRTSFANKHSIYELRAVSWQYVTTLSLSVMPVDISNLRLVLARVSKSNCSW